MGDKARRICLTITMSLLAVVMSAQVSYDVIVIDNKRIVSGSQQFHKADEEIFAGALLWAVNEGPGLKEELLNCDFVKKQFTMLCHLKRDDKDAFTCQLGVKVSQGQLVFMVDDIKITGGGIMSAFSSFDRLKPETKPKHREIVNNFQELNNRALQQLFNFIEQHNPVITNWKSICMGQIEKGMSVDEAKLIYGKPLMEQGNGNKLQLMFGSFLYVYVENGYVTSFVN